MNIALFLHVGAANGPGTAADECRTAGKGRLFENDRFEPFRLAMMAPACPPPPAPMISMSHSWSHFSGVFTGEAKVTPLNAVATGKKEALRNCLLVVVILVFSYRVRSCFHEARPTI